MRGRIRNHTGQITLEPDELRDLEYLIRKYDKTKPKHVQGREQLDAIKSLYHKVSGTHMKSKRKQRHNRAVKQVIPARTKNTEETISISRELEGEVLKSICKWGVKYRERKRTASRILRLFS